ncbi:hypothetical protein HDU79_003960 [Rhizoclosmatium sp. JEL0117]|nr:hypothetical protein HDU79_003960 [Rhizoclosmatium sp. JEL0117]
MPFQDTTTVYDQLKPFIDQEAYAKDCDSSIVILKYLTGYHSPTLQILHIWKPLLHATTFIMTPFRGSPACDFGFTPIDAALRTKVITLASLVAECPSCSALNCRIGKLGKGAYPLKPIVLTPSMISEREQVALNAVVGATVIPAARSERTRKKVVDRFGEKGLQLLGTFIASMALTNTITSLVCVDIEADVQKDMEVALAGTGWKMGRHKTASTTMNANDNQQPTSLTIFKHILKVLKEAKTTMSSFPSKPADLTTWIQSKFGFQPRYLSKMISFESKRAMCFNLHLSLFTSSTTHSPDLQQYPYSMPFKDKLTVAFVYCTAIPNTYLASHFAFLAHQHGISAESLLEAEKKSKLSLSEISESTDLMTLILMVTSRMAVRNSEFYDVAPLLFPATGNNPKSLLEILSLIGSLSMLHRYTAMWDDEAGLEADLVPVIKGEFGKAVGLSECEYSANCSTGSTVGLSNIGGTSFGGSSTQRKTVPVAAAIKEPKQSLSPDAALAWGGGLTYA